MAPPTPHDPEAGRSEAVARPSSSADEDSLAQHKMAVEMGVEGAYERKVALINRAIKHEIGFGKFQIWLFALTGMGWFVDNVSIAPTWLVGTLGGHLLREDGTFWHMDGNGAFLAGHPSVPLNVRCAGLKE